MAALYVSHVLLLLSILFIPSVSFSHMDVWLKNEMGERITPSHNRLEPYSPRRTCGGCHDYRAITSGYHFTQGFDVMKDGYNPKQPWVLSPGMFGRWLPTAATGRISPKRNPNPRTFDLSTFDWIGKGGKFSTKDKLISSACGFCHPGGGPMEFGRDQQGRADYTRNLIMGEREKWPAFDGDYSSLDTPEGKSLFSLTGVVEADCLICHLAGYDIKERNKQLSKRNYRWAATAGARMGVVRGAIFTYNHPDKGPSENDSYRGSWNLEKRPTVEYHWDDRKLFTPEGRLKGNIISKSVSYRNCLACHDLGERKNTGTIISPTRDIHLHYGFNCTDCHGLVGKTKMERLTHQIAKGHSSTNTVRDDLDGKDMKTCLDCHIEGNYTPKRPTLPPQAKNPFSTHSRIFSGYRFHTYLLDCMACHAPKRSGRALLLLDMSQGHEETYVAEQMELIKTEGDFLLEAPSPWSPWMMRSSQYCSGVPKWLMWFGNELKTELYPIPLRFVAQALKAEKMARKPIAKEGDIMRLLKRLEKMGFVKPVYVADRLFRVSGNRLNSSPLTSPPTYYPVVHGVEEKGALRSCQSCHSPKAPFFNRMELVNPRGFLLQDYPVMKEPNARPQYKSWGLKQIPAGD